MLALRRDAESVLARRALAALVRRGRVPSRTIVRGRVAAQTRREYQAKLGFGALIRRLHGGADRGRPCERHCGRRHRRGRPLRLRRSASAQTFPFWPTAVAQNAAQALYRCMKTDWGEPDPAARRSWPQPATSTRLTTPRTTTSTLLRERGRDGSPARGGGGQTLLRGDWCRARQYPPSSKRRAAMPSSLRRVARPAAFRRCLTSATATTTRPRPSSPGSTAR